ncbi:putative metalloprotease with PDZ domain [Sphaerotilus hippei]|uniref:Putative metalloprotease with PDZ domain n=1 Tax=Sphaerotilus hippei TaxID=744406 RepID=A0A318GZW5_9BURK|nr:PDZ domain-containing protein [Sphaerotilus hippei]PXW93534.1 putative metalloprotease with PDZ domain [Sphaerotilus hippei]
MVRYHLEIVDLQAHLLRVTLTLDSPAALQRLSLPVWIPGSYLVREFGRHLQSLQAWQDHHEVPLTQLDKTTWQAGCTDARPLTVSCLVYAFDASVRTAWLDRQRGFLNGTSTFLRCEGHEHRPQRLTLGPLPEGWQVATGLPAAAEGGWLAPDYDALIDHPIELGPFWRGEFVAGGVPHELVVAGALPSFDGERLLEDTRRLCEAQIRFWHGEGRPPFERYVFMLNAVDDGYGGLEHRNSTALIAGRRDLPRRGQPPGAGSDGYVTLLGLISHEYFHTWNVKRLKPREFVPYDLTRENHTELLWFFEGFTSYYDDQFLVRTGLIDEARYLKLLTRTINQVLGTPGRHVQSLARASWDAWVKYYRPDENTVNATVSYYTKGALVALALDLSLREAGTGTLDDVMHLLWQRSAPAGQPDHAGDRGIDEADIVAAVRSVAPGVAEMLPAWVHGTDDLPLERLLATMGVAWSREAPTLAHRLGARVQDSLKVQSVLRGGAAEQAGLAAGDELIALNQWRLGKLDDLPLYGAFEQAAELLVSRDRRLLNLTLPAVTALEGAVALGVGASTEARTRDRTAWLRPAVADPA